MAEHGYVYIVIFNGDQEQTSDEGYMIKEDWTLAPMVTEYKIMVWWWLIMAYYYTMVEHDNDGKYWLRLENLLWVWSLLDFGFDF